MPIPLPRLDDRGHADLLAELVQRIPGHTPEWTDPRPGDPGRAILDLVAWLGDTILYRANLIPERQRLAFLRLLDLPLRPALPAGGVVALRANERTPRARPLPPGARIDGPAAFEILDECTVLPVDGAFFVKRRPAADELDALDDVLRGLDQVYRARLGAGLTHYVTTPAFAAPVAGEGFDPIAASVDRSLWLALLAPEGQDPAAVRAQLGHGPDGARALNLGLVPSRRLPSDFAAWGPAPVPVRATWSITTGRWAAAGVPEFLALDALTDTTRGLTAAGTLRLVLPDASAIGVPLDTQDVALNAGVGARPPRLDDAKLAARVVAWIRMAPDARTTALPLAWAAVNAVRIEQLLTTTNVVVGHGEGKPGQEVALPRRSVEAATFAFAVEEPGRGFVPWRLIDDLGAAGRDDRVARLDAEAGLLRFGDGVRGMVPPAGGRILVVRLRAGGGAAGNLAPGALKAVAGAPAPIVVAQPLPLEGGQDAETLDEAERRIPGWLAHGERAVTPDDCKRLALATPAVRLGRVEVLPRFKPQQRLSDVPGVVSVMVIPAAAAPGAPNPRPDRTTLERVHGWLDARRVLGTELYVIGVDYVPCALSVAVTVADGAPRDATLRAVREVVTAFLSPLAPGGRGGAGWPLGEAVREAELEVVVARVPGVRAVGGLRVFRRDAAGAWRLAPRDARGFTRLELLTWQLPELLAVLVEEGEAPSEDGSRLAAGDAGDGDLVGIPVVPETC